jgi:hypothetical protein
MISKFKKQSQRTMSRRLGMQELADCWDSDEVVLEIPTTKPVRRRSPGALKLKELRQGDSIRNRMENLLKDSIGLDASSTEARWVPTTSRHFEFRSA